MSHNAKNPANHQAQVHDDRAARPGLDSLAPDDNSHLASPVPTHRPARSLPPLAA